MSWLSKVYSGIAVSLGIAVCAHFLGGLFPVIGGAVFGIVIGIFIRTIFGRTEKFEAGLNFTAKRMLQASVILVGSGLNLTHILQTGLGSLVIILIMIITAFTAAGIAGKILRLNFALKNLIAAGTAICGGSAIAAVAPILQAEDEEITYALSTIFLFNIAAVLFFPALGHLLGMTQEQFGLFAGTAINDTSSVVAAGYIYGDQAGDAAAIIKLTRTLMIIPVAVIYALIMETRKRKQKDSGKTGRFSIFRIFPWFVIGFLMTAGLNTFGLADKALLHFMREAGKFLIIMALAAIGLKTSLKHLLSTGSRSLMLGFAAWFSLLAAGLFIQFIIR